MITCETCKIHNDLEVHPEYHERMVLYKNAREELLEDLDLEKIIKLVEKKPELLKLYFINSPTYIVNPDTSYKDYLRYSYKHLKEFDYHSGASQINIEMFCKLFNDLGESNE